MRLRTLLYGINLTLIGCFLFQNTCAQTSSVYDSLQTVIATSDYDSAIVSAYIGLSRNALPDFDSATMYADLAMQHARKAGDSARVASSHAQHAMIAYRKGEFGNSILRMEAALEHYQRLGNKTEEMNSLNNLGILHRRLDNYGKSLSCYFKVLHYRELQGNKEKLGSIYNNIGNLYNSSDKPKEGLKYHLQALELRLKGVDSVAISSSYNNLGNTHDKLHKYDSALYYYREGLTYLVHQRDLSREASLHSNMGNVLYKLGRYSEAKEHLLQGRKIRKEANDAIGYGTALANIGRLEALLGNSRLGLIYVDSAEQIAQQMNYATLQKDVYAFRAGIYKSMRDFERAYEARTMFYNLKDSLDGVNEKQDIAKLALRYDYERQLLSDSLARVRVDKVKEVRMAEKEEKERMILYALIGLSAAVIVIALVLLRAYFVKKRSNDEISFQKDQVELQKRYVEEKNSEIVDSISYAKRIQAAILPPTNLVKQWLPDGFVLYKPKDIVAGDFYWMHEVPQPNGADPDTILFAAADCTGHGVPGAMVSVVCSVALDRTVQEFGITEPGLMLDKVRELVVETFEQSEEDVKDGMDIALCALSPGRIKYAGANNPLWIVRQGELLEIKATKQPIGKVDQPREFVTHEIELQSGDCIYVFTDGFADQFGGPKGKKFKSRQMKELFTSIASLPMPEQQERITKAFTEWKSSLEQVDDICVIGVRV